MNIRTMILTVSLIGAFATPTLANYFFNPHMGIARNVGSAPSPTPQDVRENRVPRLVYPGAPYADVMPGDRNKATNKPDENGVLSAQNDAEKSPATPRLQR